MSIYHATIHSDKFIALFFHYLDYCESLSFTITKEQRELGQK